MCVPHVCYTREHSHIHTHTQHMMFCLHLYVCTTCVPGAFGSQETAFDSQGLNLQMVASCYVDAGFELGSFGGATRTFNPRAISPALEELLKVSCLRSSGNQKKHCLKV